MKECFVPKRFTLNSRNLLVSVDEICREYLADGLMLTVRQLYYQLVSRDIIPNNEKSYNRVCSLVNDARLAGLIDWNLIEDRTRSFIRRSHWETGEDILKSAARGFHRICGATKTRAST